MQTVARSNFTTVKTEGAILPADLLQRVADGELEGLRPQDYHLGPTEKLNEAINRAWNRCTGVWQSFDQQRQNLAITDSGVTLTRERWLLILFQELGYGRLPFQGKIGVRGSGFGVGDDARTTNHEPQTPETYPISHLWGQTPIHLISFRQALERRDPAIKRSPHSLVQEFLNRSEAHLWGIVSNGLSLRLLRDNVSLTRAAYLEFDLEMMMTGQLYADFSLLWLVCHQSRVELLGVGGSALGVGDETRTTKPAPQTTNPTDCWLEKWSQEAAEQGTRALDALRDGVQEAISALGRGFLAHPANSDLRRRLSSGALTTQDYYRQLLRLVYRLIFLFVAEDRDLLVVGGSGSGGRGKNAKPDPRTPNPESRQRYTDYYSLSRLRTLAEARRGGPHPDLYRTLRRVFGLLRKGYPPLGLPALGSFLFSERSTPALDETELANTDLLNAIRALAFTIEGRVRRPVDYKNLGAEELGSVYESLLELHPQLNIAAAQFELATAAGSERKTTGSYYTPASLINSLLDTALEPVIEERLKGVRGSGLGAGEKSRTTNHEPPTTNHEETKNVESKQLPRSPGVADGDDAGHGNLHSHTNFSQRGDVRPDQPASPGRSLGAGQHRRGVRTAYDQGLPEFPDDRSRVDDGSGDADPDQPQFELPETTTAGQPAGTNQPSDPLPERPDHLTPPQDLGVRGSDFGIRDATQAPNHEPQTPTHESQTPEEAALLSIKVVDPACGSGHFLIAAANRLALHLSRIRTGDDEPGPEARREAMRDVVRHCIHGVDINEMSVELCKVALWLETLDPGKPLTFLDANILCGNSLLGATPELLKEGIPDDAFKPLTGDDRDYCKEWKARNKKERGQRVMDLDPQPWERLGDLATAMADLERLGDDSLARVQAQESKYADLIRSSAYEYSRLWADAWCAAFVWRKQPEYAGGFAYPITEAVFRQIERNPFDVAPWMRQEIERLRDEYQFFHWHLAFPQVFGVPPVGEGADNEQTGWNSGFDVVLGNPPWERIKLQEKEWFAARDPEIANARNAAARRKKIKTLAKENPTLYAEFQADKRKAEGDSHFVRNSERYPLCGRGDINTYSIFAELSRHVQSDTGRVGIIVPSGIATDSTTQYFFQDLMDRHTLVSLYDFWEIRRFFLGTDSRNSFCLITMQGSGVDNSAQAGARFVFFAKDLAELSDPERGFHLTAAEITLLNPNTRTCPIFRNKRDAALTKAIYRRAPVLIKEGPPEQNPWDIKFATMFHMSNDSELFRTRKQLEAEGWKLYGNTFRQGGDTYLPLYEAKMFHQFDHRWATYEGLDTHDLPLEEKNLPAVFVLPRYWVPILEVNNHLPIKISKDYFFALRRFARATDERTLIFGALPKVGAGDSATLCLLSETLSVEHLCGFIANVGAIPFDFAARQKVGAVMVNNFIVKQLPVLPPDTYAQPCPWGISGFGIRGSGTGMSDEPPTTNPEPLTTFILPRVLELTYTAWDLQPFAHDCGYLGPPFRWDEERRFLLRCELDAAYFYLYGIAREDVDYIMETFPIVKRKDEAAHGEYRTKQVILDIYDEMQQAIAAGQPYQTHLDPPPADSRAAHPWDEAFGEEPEELWTEKSGDRGSGLGVREKDAAYEPQTTNPDPPTTEPLILQNPVAEIKQPKKPKPTSVAQGSLLDVLPPPGGPRSVRLKRAMALGGDPSPLATRELVAFLADEDSNIRWLAGSTLVQRPTADTVAALAAFLDQAEPERVSAALPEAQRVLSLIADTAEEESVRQAAGEVLGGIIKD